ncbi:ABC transporter permease [Adhaeribacter pallidiroseus]|uniref:Transport permease protein n=1 Tax=Adhaeribacter pallidiroseus TaxID=2072847 RepID=A0A369QFJ0_9BACT|nr:ABC transporter permease [Adhaeribacter pallidiroseus]RDC62325.1 Ribosome-associated ATPase [Adhaeribacter pallidiroseus]
MKTHPHISQRKVKPNRQFFSLAKKEFFHIFRDRRTLIILLGMPIVQIIIFGFALTNEVKNSRIGVFNQAQDAHAQALINELEASRYFEVTRIFTSYSAIEEEFKKGTIKLALVLPPHFAADLKHFNKTQVQLIADASDPNVANTLINYATAVILDFQDRLTNNNTLPYTIRTETRMLYNPQLQGAYSFVPGVMAMVLMLVCTMMTAITIVREKELGTMEILLVSPVQPLKVIIAKAIPYLLLSMLNITSILLLSVFVLQVPINGSLLLLLAASTLFIITSLSLGLLISTITASQQTAMFISLTGLFLPTVMLSGFMFPIENMPLPLQVVSNLVPAKWFYIIVRTVMIKGAGLAVIWKEALVLTSMTLLLLGLSMKNFKIRLA